MIIDHIIHDMKWLRMWAPKKNQIQVEVIDSTFFYQSSKLTTNFLSLNLPTLILK